MVNDCPLIHPKKKKRSTSPARRERGNAKDSDKGKVTVAIVNIPKHRPWNTSGKLLQLETSRNSHLKAEGNLEQVGQSTMSMKSILSLRRKLPSEKNIIRFAGQSLDRAKFRDKFASLNVNQTGSKKKKREISKCTTV